MAHESAPFRVFRVISRLSWSNPFASFVVPFRVFRDPTLSRLSWSNSFAPFVVPFRDPTLSRYFVVPLPTSPPRLTTQRRINSTVYR